MQRKHIGYAAGVTRAGSFCLRCWTATFPSCRRCGRDARTDERAAAQRKDKHSPDRSRAACQHALRGADAAAGDIRTRRASRGSTMGYADRCGAAGLVLCGRQRACRLNTRFSGGAAPTDRTILYRRVAGILGISNYTNAREDVRRNVGWRQTNVPALFHSRTSWFMALGLGHLAGYLFLLVLLSVCCFSCWWFNAGGEAAAWRRRRRRQTLPWPHAIWRAARWRWRFGSLRRRCSRRLPATVCATERLRRCLRRACCAAIAIRRDY